MLFALLCAASLSPGVYAVDTAASTVRYTVVHKLHEVDAASKEVEGKAMVRPDGSVLTEVRAPIASFRSGDGNRDEHMMEVMNVGTYPAVTFKGVAKLPAPGELPQGPLQMDGQVDLHGVKTRVAVPLSVTPQPDGSLRVRGSLEVSLDQHHIDRPSLLFVKVDDACRIDVDLLLRGQKP